MATSVTIVQAAEIGKQLTFTQSSSATSLAGYTVTMLVTAKGSTSVGRFSCSLDGTGKIPSRITVGTEFPTAGTYYIQLEATAAGEKFYSPQMTVNALPNLG